MKLRHLLWLGCFLLLFSSFASAAIQAGVTDSCNASSATSCQIGPLTVPAGATIIAYIWAVGTPTFAFNSSGSTACGTFTGLNSSSTNNRIAYILQSNAATCTFTLSRGSTSSTVHGIIQIYTGVGEVAYAYMGASGAISAGGLCSFDYTPAGVGNVVMGYLWGNGNSAWSASPLANFRRSVNNVAGMSALVDKTAEAPGSITLGAISSIAFSGGCQRYAVELTPSGPPARTALPDDHTQSILLGGAMGYHLPASLLSSATVQGGRWCTWLMPTGSASYELTVDSSKHLNGQTAPIALPHWQMIRICQDSNGNYWTPPPLVAGPGISITSSPTQVEISAGAAPNGMTYIAGGTAHVPGSVQVAADSCATLYTSTSSSASGVLQNDVVSWSLQPYTGSVPGWAQVNFLAIAQSDSILWRACNSTATAYTPSARDVNWYVIRKAVVGVAGRHRVVHHRGKKQ